MSKADSFHLQVRQWREAAHLSQQAFADALGYSRNYISQIELGKRSPGARFRRDLVAFVRAQGEAGGSRGARARLKAARERAGLSYAQLARLTKRPAAILEQLENGTIGISEDHIEALCQHLPGLTPEDLKAGSDQPEIFSETGLEATLGARLSLNLPPGMKGRYVPLLSTGEAGPWDAVHSDAVYDHTAIFALNVDDRRAFAIKVSGNSMEPRLSDGDVVICSPAQTLHNGDAAVVRTHSEQVFIKYWRQIGEYVKLESANPAYKPIDVPLSEIAGAWPIVQRINAGKITKGG